MLLLVENNHATHTHLKLLWRFLVLSATWEGGRNIYIFRSLKRFFDLKSGIWETGVEKQLALDTPATLGRLGSTLRGYITNT